MRSHFKKFDPTVTRKNSNGTVKTHFLIYFFIEEHLVSSKPPLMMVIAKQTPSYFKHCSNFILFHCCSWFGLCTLPCQQLRKQLPCMLQHTFRRCAGLAEFAPTPSFWGSAPCLVHLQSKVRLNSSAHHTSFLHGTILKHNLYKKRRQIENK